MKKILVMTLAVMISAGIPAFAMKTIYNDPLDRVVPSRTTGNEPEAVAVQTVNYGRKNYDPGYRDIIKVRYNGNEIRPELIGTRWRVGVNEHDLAANAQKSADGNNSKYARIGYGKSPRYIREAADYFVVNKTPVQDASK